MYPWVVFLHVLSSFLFMFTHGAVAVVMFTLQAERSPERIRSLLATRRSAQLPFTITSSIMFLSGIALGFMGGWWGKGWIWGALGLLIAISAVMGFLGRNRLDRIQTVVDSGKPETADLEEAILAANPRILSYVGLVGFAIILWLMMFKPF